jgi:hypothetical protein
LCEPTVNQRFEIERLDDRFEIALPIWFLVVDVGMDFQKYLITGLGDQEPAIEQNAGRAALDVVEQFGDVVGMRAYATMSPKMIDAGRRNCAMNAIAAQAKP